MKKKINFTLALLKNEQGILLMDFIFAFILLFSFSVLLFSLSLTLTVTEVLQYITFSSARVYAVADVDKSISKQNAEAKYQQLIESPQVASLLRNNWFELSSDINILDGSGSLAQDRNKNSFHGASLKFRAKILDKNLPFIGSTNSSDDSEAFKTEVSSFLGAEPSQRDCEIFNKDRWTWLKEQRGYIVPDLSAGSLNKYVEIADNGC